MHIGDVSANYRGILSIGKTLLHHFRHALTIKQLTKAYCGLVIAQVPEINLPE
jgi:hypothetical protein